MNRAEKGRAVALGPMFDAEQDWHEHSICAPGAINDCD